MTQVSRATHFIDVDWICLDYALVLEHVICLLHLALVLESHTPAVEQLYTPRLHFLCRVVTQVLQQYTCQSHLCTYTPAELPRLPIWREISQIPPINIHLKKIILAKCPYCILITWGDLSIFGYFKMEALHQYM